MPSQNDLGQGIQRIPSVQVPLPFWPDTFISNKPMILITTQKTPSVGSVPSDISTPHFER